MGNNHTDLSRWCCYEITHVKPLAYFLSSVQLSTNGTAIIIIIITIIIIISWLVLFWFSLSIGDMVKDGPVLLCSPGRCGAESRQYPQNLVSRGACALFEVRSFGRVPLAHLPGGPIPSGMI